MVSSDEEVFTGKCACDSIKYEVKLPKGDLPKQVICHCNYCKRMTGACFTRTLFIPAQNFKITSGEPKKFIQRKDPPQGRFFFCGECGSQLFVEHAYSKGNVNVRVGTLDRQEMFEEVQMQVMCEFESKWLKEALGKEEGRFMGFPPMS